MGKHDVQPTKPFSTKASVLYRVGEKDQNQRTAFRNRYAFTFGLQTPSIE